MACGGQEIEILDEHQIKEYALQNPSRLVGVDVRLFDDERDLIATAVSRRSPNLHQWLNTYLRVREISWTIDEIIRAYPPPQRGKK